MVGQNEGQGSLSKQQISDWFARARPEEVVEILPKALDTVATYSQQHRDQIAQAMSPDTRAKLFREPVG